MISIMVEEFREMQSQLVRELEHYETPRFKALDDRLSHLFEAIYRHKPQNAAEAHAVLGFLLDLIENNDASDNHRFIERIREIAGTCAAHPAPALEITCDAGI